MKTFASLCAITLLLAACSAQPPQSISEQLKNTSPADKGELLRVACLNEADNSPKATFPKLRGPHRNRLAAPSEETQRLKDMCRKMAETEPRSDQSRQLASTCGGEIANGNARASMQKICETMTGVSIKASK